VSKLLKANDKLAKNVTFSSYVNVMPYKV